MCVKYTPVKIQGFGVMDPCTKSSGSKCSQAVCDSVVCLSGNFKNPRGEVVKVTLNGSMGSMGVEDASTVGFPLKKAVGAGWHEAKREATCAPGSCCASDDKEPGMWSVKL